MSSSATGFITDEHHSSSFSSPTADQISETSTSYQGEKYAEVDVQGSVRTTWTYTGGTPNQSSYPASVFVRCVSTAGGPNGYEEFQLGSDNNATGYAQQLPVVIVPKYVGKDGVGDSVWTFSWTTPYMRACGVVSGDGQHPVTVESQVGASASQPPDETPPPSN